MDVRIFKLIENEEADDNNINRFYSLIPITMIIKQLI